jgi:hypothetical protein
MYRYRSTSEVSEAFAGSFADVADSSAAIVVTAVSTAMMLAEFRTHRANAQTYKSRDYSIKSTIYASAQKRTRVA